MDVRTDDAAPLKLTATINTSPDGESFDGNVFLVRSLTKTILSIVFCGELISVPLTDEQAQQLGRELCATKS
jgi:hypothetical protein